jgi:hypothetical protein
MAVQDDVRMGAPVCVSFLVILLTVVFFPHSGLGQSQLPSCKTSDDSLWDNCQGSKTYGDGSKYVGEFRNGKPHGFGTMTSEHGKYVGQFDQNRFHGDGTSYDRSGAIIYSGKFVSGQRAALGMLGTESGSVAVPMEVNGGVYVVPVRFNNAITLDAIVDSGASDVSVPADIVMTLIRTKTVTQSDFIGTHG